VQAPQLPEPEVEAELAGPGRVQEVLPLVRAPHGAPGDPLAPGRWRGRRVSSAARGASSSRRSPAVRRPLRPVGGGDDDAEPRRPRREEALRRGIPGLRFAQESAAELRKVEWPDQHAVVSGTAVVLIACVIVGAFLWLNDEVWKYVVQHVLLR
jgi:preprotein translocase SecE subunit